VEWLAFLGAWMTMMLGSIPQQDVFQRVTSAKSAREDRDLGLHPRRRAIYFCFTFVPMFIAYSATLIDPEQFNELIATDSQLVLPTLVLQHTPLFAQAIFFGAVLAAIMSCSSATLLAPSVPSRKTSCAASTRTAWATTVPARDAHHHRLFSPAWCWLRADHPTPPSSRWSRTPTKSRWPAPSCRSSSVPSGRGRRRRARWRHLRRDLLDSVELLLVAADRVTAGRRSQPGAAATDRFHDLSATPKARLSAASKRFRTSLNARKPSSRAARQNGNWPKSSPVARLPRLSSTSIAASPTGIVPAKH
jgi:hypothetical protein